MLPIASLTTLVLAAMVAFVPPRSHVSFEPPSATEARYLAIAGDIALAAQEAPVPALGAAETAVLLASVASYESAFSGPVDTCQRRGGTRAAPSWSIFQVVGSRAELCASRLAAARIALGILSVSLTRCRWRGQDALSFFTLGKCGQDEKARWRWSRAERWWRLNPFDTGEST